MHSFRSQAESHAATCTSSNCNKSLGDGNDVEQDVGMFLDEDNEDNEDNAESEAFLEGIEQASVCASVCSSHRDRTELGDDEEVVVSGEGGLRNLNVPVRPIPVNEFLRQHSESSVTSPPDSSPW